MSVKETKETKTKRVIQWLIDKFLPLFAIGVGGVCISILIWGFQLSADVSASAKNVAVLIGDRVVVAQNTIDIKVLAEGTRRQINAINGSMLRIEGEIKEIRKEIGTNMTAILARLPLK